MEMPWRNDATVEARADLEDIIPIVDRLRGDDLGARQRAECMQRAARRAFVETVPGAGSDAQRAAWMQLLQWLSTADADPKVEEGAALDAAGFMQPLDHWVAAGVCHPYAKQDDTTRFYQILRRRGRKGVHYRRRRATCVNELTIDA